ncbi:MAG: AraC family transcriptional regulator [Bacteroidales bacterium]|nr:AraC family transcriptional regulator [Bacteroidales bacterium]
MATVRLKDGFIGERYLVLPKMVVDMLEDDELTRQLYITDIGFYPSAQHHYRERLQPIDQFVLIYCVGGAGWYRIGNTCYEVKTDDFFILPAGAPHAYGSNEGEPWTIYWVHFKGALAPPLARGLHMPHSVAPTTNSRNRDRLSLFEEIFYTLKSGLSIDSLHFSMAMFHYFLASLQYVREFRNATGDGKQRGPGDMAQAAIHYMKENLERQLSITALAQYVGYTPGHFTTLFHRAIGHSPRAYFNMLKMQEACRMLEETDMKINQIALKLGYTDPFYFTRLFTKIMGMAPSDYRLAPH